MTNLMISVVYGMNSFGFHNISKCDCFTFGLGKYRNEEWM